MGSIVKYLAIGIGALIFILAVMGMLALSEPDIHGISDNALFNQSDLIVSASESFINSILQSELKERQLQNLKNVTVYFNEGGPVEILAELQVSLSFMDLDPKIKMEVNLSAENNSLKISPNLIALGKLNIPRSIWIGPVNTAVAMVEDAANQAISERQKGFKIVGIYIGDHYLTIIIDAPPPEELKKALQ
jgi:hypothetical protein